MERLFKQGKSFSFNPKQHPDVNEYQADEKESAKGTFGGVDAAVGFKAKKIECDGFKGAPPKIHPDESVSEGEHEESYEDDNGDSLED